MQAFGRAVRDGTNSEAVLFFHGRQLGLCDPEMLDFIKCTTCRRENILAFFMTVMKTAESFQATYVATFVPKTVSVGKHNVTMTQKA